MAVAGFNMTVVNLLHTLSLWPLARQRMTFGTTEIPGLFTTAQHLIISLIVVEPGFYYLHRSVHELMTTLLKMGSTTMQCVIIGRDMLIK